MGDTDSEGSVMWEIFNQNQLLAETPNIKRLPMCLVDIELHFFIDRYNFLGRRQFSASIWRVRDFMQATVILSAVLYSWVFIFAGLEYENERSFCGLSQNASFFGCNVSDKYFVFTLVDTAICTLIPAILIIIVNSFSTYRYRQCMKIYSSGVLRVRFLRGPPTDEQTRYVSEETTAKKLLLSTSNHTNTQHSTQSHRSTANCGSKLRSSDLQLSRTLLIVTSTFVLLTVPSYCMRIIQYLFSPSSHLFHLIHYLTYLIYYWHHSVLFYMYIFWSPQMKKQLKPTAMRLLECYCFKTVPEFGHRSTSMQEFNNKN
ncbi:hypothetical protein WR25_10529 [Diploscapter pachys]|uniref:G-protein coupled receptors family 1 profile domain-containing protein n=1 Tax=Diploscapter pachys TaxID=2018661 RepID=A0A2A2JYT5_9BILA|nr:hypothetical protein WR25_10529 [Diploscapter pachys]